jgi:NNP family nitrate/nitrite transporter-like MFS transporter
LGVQAGIGNFGVSLVQFVTPWIVGFALLGGLGASQSLSTPGGESTDVWYQNAAFVYIPFVIIGSIVAWSLLKSVPVTANFKQQLDIFRNSDTWFMTALYVMTFGIFSGFAAQFGLLIKNIYGAGNTAIVETLSDGSTQLLVSGYDVPDPLKFAFLGPLVGAGARVAFSPLTDRWGGAPWTLLSGIGILGSLVFTFLHLDPDPAAGADALSSDFTAFLWGMLAVFLFSGMGNASTFKQMPMIFQPRQAGGVIGWTSAIAAYGPFLFGVGLATLGDKPFYGVVIAFTMLCIGITWVRYARPGAPHPG